MAVRFSADGQDYTRTLSLGSQSVYTIACWVKISTDRNTWSCAWNLDNGSAADSIYMETLSDGTTMVVYRNDTGPPTGIAMTVGTWYYTCAVVNSTSLTVYYRAASAATLSNVTDSFSSSGNTLTTLRLGESVYGAEWLNGCVQGFRLWTGIAMTADEALRESHSQRPVHWGGLAAWYPLHTAETADYSGNGRTLSGGSGATREDGPPIPWGRGNPSPRRFSPMVVPEFAGWGVPI